LNMVLQKQIDWKTERQPGEKSHLLQEKIVSLQINNLYRERLHKSGPLIEKNLP
jgi:hypothetical protein